VKVIFVCAVCNKREDVTKTFRECNYKLFDTAKKLGWEKLKGNPLPEGIQKEFKQERETLGFICPECQN